MATFYDNLRASSTLPQQSPAWKKRGKIPSGEQLARAWQDNRAEAIDYMNYEKQGAAEEAKQTEPLREKIRQLSDGRITVSKSIHNEETLKGLLVSVLRMKEFNDGEMPTPYVELSDPGSNWNEKHPAAVGLFYGSRGNGTKNSPYKIELRRTDNPSKARQISVDAEEQGWWPKTWGAEESQVPTHELSHSVQQGIDKKFQKPELTLDYAEKVRRQEFMDTHTAPQKLFSEAARNLGFNSVQEAAKSISGYAGGNSDDDTAPGWGRKKNLPEVFAEAYTDVMYNGNDAAPYSRELVKLYTNYVDEYEKAFGRDNKDIDSFKHALGLLPPLREEKGFIEKMRRLGVLPQK